MRAGKSFSIELEYLKKLQKLAEKRGTSPSDILNEILSEYFGDKDGKFGKKSKRS